MPKPTPQKTSKEKYGFNRIIKLALPPEKKALK
jgi:hypothetical protein